MAIADGAGTRRVPLPREVARRRREPGGLAVFLAAVAFYPMTWFLARRRMVGLENVPATGPALLVCNHVSYLDPVYTAVFVHRARRTPRFLAKDSLWRVPVFGRIMAGSRQIPVARGSRDAGSSLAAAEAAFDDDGVVVIYPEGTITRDPDGWPMAARSGAARLALTHGVPVIPVVHWGTLQVYDHYGKRFRPSPLGRSITVRAGSPVELDDLRARAGDRAPGARLMKETTDRLMDAVTALLSDVRGETRPPEEAG